MTARICRFLPVVLISLFIGCEHMGVQPDADNTAPVAGCSISPSTGDSTKSFILSGLSSTDKEDITDLLEFRWDLNNDSIWDTEFVAYPYLITHFPVPGKHTVRMEVRDRHGLSDQATAEATSFGINNDTSHIVDPRDGQYYRTVRINGAWWMAENLNFGTMVPETLICTDNGIYEKYSYHNDPSIKGAVGGYFTYYHWNEVIDYDTIHPQGLCPPGWKVPGNADWEALSAPFEARGLTYFSTGGFSRLNLSSIGIHELRKTWEVMDLSPCTSCWMYFSKDFKKDFYRGYGPCPFYFGSNSGIASMRYVNDSIRRNGGALPVRCIKQ